MSIQSDWVWTYYNNDEIKINMNNAGKWMYHFNNDTDFKDIQALCKNALEQGVTSTIKHTNKFQFENKGTGITIFFVEKDDIDTHKKVINYMIKNNAIRRKKDGSLYNISFKLNEDTRNKIYGKDLNTELKLENFIDLKTGEWIYK